MNVSDRPQERGSTVAKTFPYRPGLWLVETVLEDFEVRGVVVVGTERAVVWDTLARPRDMAAVGPLYPGLPSSVVYSHGDWDHVWGSGGLTPPPDEIIAHDACALRFLAEIPRELEEKQLLRPAEYGEVRLLPPTRTFSDRLDLELGGLTLELHALPGHTPDSVVGYLPEWRVLLAGDCVESPLPFLYPESPLDEWIRGLEEWAETLSEGSGEAVVIPSHGAVGGPGLLRSNARYLKDLRAGRDPDLPRDLSPFYRDTHANNRSFMGGAGTGRVGTAVVDSGR